MIAVQVIDVKKFMAGLFTEGVFDGFLLQRARVLTASELILEGKRSKAWYDADEWDALIGELDDSWMTWGELRKLIFDYIKGSRTPQSMRIDLCASRHQRGKILKEGGVRQETGRMEPSFHLQIRYGKGELMLVTDVSFSEFTADKSAEYAWNAVCCQFLERKKISFHLLNGA